MTIGNAMKFIDKGQVDAELRSDLNRTDTIEQVYELLAEKNMSFSATEFAEAFTNRLVNCQHHELAEQLQEFKMWWEMLHKILGSSTPSAGSPCESGDQCSTGKSCSSCCG